MIEGFWTAIFTSGNLSGGGVIYLNGGSLVGGDSQYFYLGTYDFEERSQTLMATIKVIAFVGGAVSIFGIPTSHFDVTMTGKVSDQAATARGYLTQAPSLQFTAQLLKRTGVIIPPGAGNAEAKPWSTVQPK